MTSLKPKLYNKCLCIIKERISSLRSILNETQSSANNETKSSAGDKHETARAMAQLETEKLTSQITEALKIEQTLRRINPNHHLSSATLGSVVYTNNGNFYIAASIGKVEIKSESFFVISPVSPIAKLLLTKKEKESFSFNNKSYLIEKIV